MKCFWATAFGGAAVLVLAGAISAAGGARTQVATGDTCSASGSGTSYVLHITAGGGAQQYGFAFRAAGATVTNAVIPGNNGSFSTQNLASNTSGAWVSDTPLTGTLTANVTTSGSPSSIMIVPAGQGQASYFNAVRCKPAEAAPRAAVFSVVGHVAYRAASHAWQLVVAVPASGTVSAAELEPTIGTGSAKPVTARALVHVKRVTVKTSGRFTLILRPTAAGSARIAKGPMFVRLRVTFDAATGKSATKLLGITLRR